MTRPAAYIIGSGPSLLNLTEEEVAALNQSSFTLSLNCYLQHWELVGVIPRCHMMADGQFPAIRMFVEETRRIERLGGNIRYFVNAQYLRYFPRGADWRQWKHALRKRWDVWRNYGYRVPVRLSRDCIEPFCQISETRFSHFADEDGWYWATSLDQPLYFFRGTLTSAINLVSVIWPECDIKLLGVDLNSYGYFFDPNRGREERQVSPEEIRKRIGETSARHHEKSHSMDTHATAVTYDVNEKKSLPGIQSAFPRIREELARSGRELYCCNPQSLLVQDGACPFAPVLSD